LGRRLFTLVAGGEQPEERNQAKQRIETEYPRSITARLRG
jgi:hypothetical protein